MWHRCQSYEICFSEKDYSYSTLVQRFEIAQFSEQTSFPVQTLVILIKIGIERPAFLKNYWELCKTEDTRCFFSTVLKGVMLCHVDGRNFLKRSTILIFSFIKMSERNTRDSDIYVSKSSRDWHVMCSSWMRIRKCLHLGLARRWLIISSLYYYINRY